MEPVAVPEKYSEEAMLTRSTRIIQFVMVLTLCAGLLMATEQCAVAGEIFTWGRDCYDWGRDYILGEADINPDYITESTIVGRVIRPAPLMLELLQINGEDWNPGVDRLRYNSAGPLTVAALEGRVYTLPAVTPGAFDQAPLYQYNDIIQADIYGQSRCDPVGKSPPLVHDIRPYKPVREGITGRFVLLRYGFGKGGRIIVYHDGRIEYYFGYRGSAVAATEHLTRNESLALRQALQDFSEMPADAASLEKNAVLDGYLIVTRNRYFVTSLPTTAAGVDGIVNILNDVRNRLRKTQQVKFFYWNKSAAKVNPWDTTHFTFKELLQKKSEGIPFREGHQLTNYLRNNLAKHPDDPAFITDGGKMYHIILGGYAYDTLRIREVTVEKNETRWRRWPANLGIRLKDIPPDGIVIRSGRLRPEADDFLDTVNYAPRFVEDGFEYERVDVRWLAP